MRQILANSNQLRQIFVARRRATKQPQRALAAKMALSQNRLSELETNPASLTVERLLELCNLLGLELVIQDKSTARPKPKAEW